MKAERFDGCAMHDGIVEVTHLSRAIIVAIPVHNEAGYIEQCLNALAEQSSAAPFQVVTLLNNCTDGTPGIVRGLQSTLPYVLHVREQWFDPPRANAGMARRLAACHAQALAGTDGIVLTTDADSRVAQDWIATNIAEIDAGADAVAGMAVLDERDAAELPQRLFADEEKSDIFSSLLDEIDWLIDPDPADPWPRHTEHSGASIAVRARYLAWAGGIPAVPLGEDRELFGQLRRIDARIRHSRNVTVTVSGRMVGRAQGGMADTIARRLLLPDQWLDDCLECADTHVRRAMLRASAREAWTECATDVSSLAAALRLSVAKVQSALEAETFGRAWCDLECASSALLRRKVPVKDVARETRKAKAIVARLRNGDCLGATVHRADNERFSGGGQHEEIGVSAG
jgi:hypothetical protein